MYTISKEVRNNIFDKFMDVVETEGYGYSLNAINKILDTWFERKNRLMEILSKHPKWNPDKLLIQFDCDYSRDICTDEVKVFSNWLYRNMTYEERKEKCFVVDFIYNRDNQFFNSELDEEIFRMNEINPNYHLRNNMKTSKAIGKICREEGWDKLDGYNSHYAALCDCLNPIKVKKHTCISLNPIDFLYMSNGKSWSSCHSIIKDNDGDTGGYSGGTISYMLDENSFLFYTTDKDCDESRIEFEPKLQREVFAYKDFLLFQSRLYPQSNDCGAEQAYKDIREIVQKVISDCISENNLWETRKSDVEEHVKKGVGALCYADWEDGCPGAEHCRISSLKGKDTSDVVITLGAKAYCICCGYINEDHENISCCESGAYYCEECGCRIREDDAVWIDDRLYCEDCVTLCEDCDEYVPRENTNYVDGRCICDRCYEEYQECENCHDMVHQDYIRITAYDEFFCPSCFSFIVKECSECGDNYVKSDLTYDEETGEYYCEDCYKELVERRKEERGEE